MAQLPLWRRTTQTHRADLESPNSGMIPGWQLFPYDSLPLSYPPGYKEKIDSVLRTKVFTSTGGLYIIDTAFRLDLKANAVDRDSFVGIILNATGANREYVQILHANYSGRTTPIPSGLTYPCGYYYNHLLSGLHAGSFGQLPPELKTACNLVISEIRERVDRGGILSSTSAAAATQLYCPTIVQMGISTERMSDNNQYDKYAFALLAAFCMTFHFWSTRFFDYSQPLDFSG